MILSVLILANNRASAAMALLGRQAMSLQTAMTYGALAVGAGIAVAAGASIDLATKFNQSMGKIAALTGTSQAQLQQYQDALLAMAPSLDQSPKALADGLYFVISAGYQGQQALDVLKYSAEAAAASITPMASVTDLATTYMKAYRRQNLSAADAVSNLIKVVTYGKVTMSSLATSFGFVAVTAANAGLSANEAAAAVSTLSQTAGEHGSRRVMLDLDFALRSLGIRMENVSKNAEKMKGLKAPWDAAAFAAMNFGQKLQYIANETGGIGYLDQTQVAAYEATGNLKNLAQATAHANSNFMTLVGGAAAFLPMAMLLSDKGKEYNYILSQMGGGAKAVDDAFKTMRQTTGQQLRMFEMQLESIGTVIGLKLLPVINQFIATIYHLASQFAGWISQAKNWETLKYAIIGIAIVVAAVLTPAIVGFVMAAAPVVLSMAAFIAGGILLGRAIQAVVAHFGGWNGVLKQLAPVLAFLRPILTQAGDALKKAFADPAIQAALRQLQSAFVQYLPWLKLVALIVGGVLVVAFEFLVATLRGLISALPGIIQAFSGVLEVLGAVGRIILDVFTGKWKDIPAALGQLLGGLKDVFVGLVRAILGNLGGFFSQFLDLIPAKAKAGIAAFAITLTTGIQHGLAGLVGAIGTGLANVGRGIAGAAGAVGGAIVGGITAGMRAVGTAVTNVGQGIAGGAHWLYQHNYYVQAATDMTVALFKRVRTAIDRDLAFVKNVVATVWNAIRTLTALAWGLIQQDILTPIARIWSAIQATFTKVLAWLGGIWQQVAGQIKRAWDTAIGILGGLYQRVSQAIQKNVVKPITDAISGLVKMALSWGENLLKQFVQGIKNQTGAAGAAAQGVLKQVGGWLGFHSPAPNVPESAHWGSNLVNMFALDMQRALPAIGRAAQQVVRAASLSPTPGSALGGLGGAGANAAYSLAGLGGGGTATHYHNWAGAFPSATSRDEITAALQSVFDQRERDTYRRGRRAGMGGGLRAGV